MVESIRARLLQQWPRHVDCCVSYVSEEGAQISQPRPTLSVVIPTRGRPERLAVSLAALSRQSVPPLEIIVVDDGSPDAAAVAAVVAEAGAGAQLVRQSGAGVAAARNAGVRVARGACVAFTDDDCEAAPDWVEQLTGAISNGADAVGGQMINACPENPFDSALQVIQDFLSVAGSTSSGRATYAPGANLALKRSSSSLYRSTSATAAPVRRGIGVSNSRSEATSSSPNPRRSSITAKSSTFAASGGRTSTMDGGPTLSGGKRGKRVRWKDPLSTES